MGIIVRQHRTPVLPSLTFVDIKVAAIVLSRVKYCEGEVSKSTLIVMAQYCYELLEVDQTGYYTVAIGMPLHKHVRVFFFLYPFSFYKINTKRLFKPVSTGGAICGHTFQRVNNLAYLLFSYHNERIQPYWILSSSASIFH